MRNRLNDKNVGILMIGKLFSQGWFLSKRLGNIADFEVRQCFR